MTDPLERLRRQARTLKRDHDAGAPRAAERLAVYPPRPETAHLKHADYLHVIAREQGFASWPDLKAAVEVQGMDRAQRLQRLKIALMHGQTGVVERLLAETPDLANGQFGLQVALYGRAAVASALAEDPARATRQHGPRTPILHLAFSRMIHAWPEKRGDMLDIAEMLVARGADVNDGAPADDGTDHKLSALYGALGHANNMVLAEWLLDRGADPDDNESLYHATELGHHDGLRLLLAHGARVAGTNAILRALDFNDHVAVRLLLDAAAEQDSLASELVPSLHHAVRRMCDGDMIDLLLGAGADPLQDWRGHSAHVRAAVYGNADALERFAALGTMPALSRDEALLAQAARGEAAEGQWLNPEALPPEFRNLIRELVHMPGKVDHVRHLVALGIEYDRPDPVEKVTPVQAAGWQGLPEMMACLLSLGPDLSFVNGYGGTLLSTIIHGSENCPERTRRDHVTCARIALEHGVALPRRAVDLAGDPDMQAFLSDWAAAHPGAVVDI
ncbi:ankyrin repeat domain-containing protein [Anianabacter salinae]|uniref:ankyrin repeat domain-containing protein n=1 Tax=Anianabacter salinae TaxID=2851023 RepID=UPI00225E5E67|nr:hypothetical protein [Anianabacter salinae]MBV0910799.1 hypothetical protein [Anianabacter salinae]